jgi:hypothetical protein
MMPRQWIGLFGSAMKVRIGCTAAAMSCCGGSASRSSTGTVGPPEFQEQSVGRHKNSGAPLGRDHEFDPPDLTATRNDGDLLIPESTHIRLATAGSNEGAQILRRPYSYNDGVDFTIERWPSWRRGVEYDAGLLFVCYQRDYGGEDSAILPPSAIPQYRPRRCKKTATLEEPGSVEWLIAQSERVRRSMSMKKRAEPQHADPAQAIGARKSGDNPASPLPRTGSSNPLPSSGESIANRMAPGAQHHHPHEHSPGPEPHLHHPHEQTDTDDHHHDRKQSPRRPGKV